MRTEYFMYKSSGRQIAETLKSRAISQKIVIIFAQLFRIYFPMFQLFLWNNCRAKFAVNIEDAVQVYNYLVTS